MTNWPLLGFLLAGELAVLPFTIKAYSVESRLAQRDDDIRKSKAGFEAAVQAQLADVYERAERVRLGAESVRDALTGADFNDELASLAEDAPRIGFPERAEARLRRATYAVAACMTLGHAAAPLFLIDNIKDSTFLSEPYDGIAAGVFVASVALAIIGALVVWRVDAAFEKTIKKGKAAGDV